MPACAVSYRAACRFMRWTRHTFGSQLCGWNSREEAREGNQEHVHPGVDVCPPLDLFPGNDKRRGFQCLTGGVHGQRPTMRNQRPRIPSCKGTNYTVRQGELSNASKGLPSLKRTRLLCLMQSSAPKSHTTFNLHTCSSTAPCTYTGCKTSTHVGVASTFRQPSSPQGTR